jgi:hypothetical protein
VQLPTISIAIASACEKGYPVHTGFSQALKEARKNRHQSSTLPKELREMKMPISVLVKGLVCFAGLAFLMTAAQAANPANINVTVTIQNLSVSATGPIAFGTVTAGSATVSSDSSHVINDGNVTETYSLNLTDPAGWTSVQAPPGADNYALSAQFNGSQPASAGFVYANHALSTVSEACTGSKFAGSQTGVSVAAGAARYLWLKFEAPTSTTVFTEQTIVVTITAAAA